MEKGKRRPLENEELQSEQSFQVFPGSPDGVFVISSQGAVGNPLCFL